MRQATPIPLVPALEGPNDGTAGRWVARRDMGELSTYPAMQRRQPMKRNGGIQVMFGVIRHVPHQRSYRERGQGRARIGQTVVVAAAPSMLDDQQGADGWLRQDCRQEPVGPQR